MATDAGDNGAEGEEAFATSIGTGSVSSGTDTATLTIDGTDTWAGTLTWSLCGPDDALTTCDPADGVEVTSRTVDQDSVGRRLHLRHGDTDVSRHVLLDGGVRSGRRDRGSGRRWRPGRRHERVLHRRPGHAERCPTQASCTGNPCVLGATPLATLRPSAAPPASPAAGRRAPRTRPSIATTPGDPANSAITWKLYAPSDGADTGLRATTTPHVTVTRQRRRPRTRSPIRRCTPTPSGLRVGRELPGQQTQHPRRRHDTGCDDPAMRPSPLSARRQLTTAAGWLPNDTDRADHEQWVADRQPDGHPLRGHLH